MLDVGFRHFLWPSTLCVQATEVLMRLHICAGSSDGLSIAARTGDKDQQLMFWPLI